MRLYVGNLPRPVDPELVRRSFARFGEVREVILIQDRETRGPRNFAFVEMAGEKAGEAAIRGLHRHKLGGRKLRVCVAQPRTAAPERRAAERAESRTEVPDHRSRRRSRRSAEH